MTVTAGQFVPSAVTPLPVVLVPLNLGTEDRVKTPVTMAAPDAARVVKLPGSVAPANVAVVTAVPDAGIVNVKPPKAIVPPVEIVTLPPVRNVPLVVNVPLVTNAPPVRNVPLVVNVFWTLKTAPI